METEIVNLRDAIRAGDVEQTSLRAEADKVKAQMRESGVDFAKDADAFSKIDEAYKAADAKRDAVAELRVRETRLLEIVGERADESKPSTERKEARTIAERFIASNEYKALRSSGVLEMEAARVQSGAIQALDREGLKDLIRQRTTVDNTAGSGGGRIWSDRLEGFLVEKPARQIRLVDLVTVGDTDSDTVEWATETTVTDAVVETPYGTSAPESAYGYTKASTTVKRVPHFVPATKGALMDGGQLQMLLENRLARGVRLRLESQMLAGNNTGENLEGLATVAGTLSQALSTDTRWDAVHKAVTQVRLNYFDEPTVIGLHPTDYEKIVLEKDSLGNYVHGRGPTESSVATLWGLTPVVSAVFTAGTPWVGDFSQAYLWIRTGLSLAASDSHQDFFIKGLVAIIAEMRVAYKVTQPLAFCKITGF